MAKYEERLEQFFMQYTKQVYQKGDTLIWGGREPDGIFYLRAGNVRQYSISPQTGNTLTLHMYQPKSFFPMIWALAEKRNTYFFDAMGPIEVYRAPKDKVLEFFRNDPEVMYHFAKRAMAGLNGLLMRLETYAFNDVYGRLISELLYLSKHFGKPHEDGLVLPHFTHQELADFLGAARETTTVAMDKLEKTGLILPMGHNIYIPSLQLLVDELNKKT